MHDLNDRVGNGTGWELREAFDLNDSGVIVGQGALNGATHAFMLLPMSRFPRTPPCLVGPVWTQVPTAPSVTQSTPR